MQGLEEIRSFFANDRYATQTTGIEILEAGRGHSKVQLRLDDRHRNALGIVMGAVYFTMADFAFAVATNSCPEAGEATVTLSSQINFIASCRGDLLFAEATARKDGRSAVFYDIDIYELSEDNKRRPVASSSITGLKIASHP